MPQPNPSAAPDWRRALLILGAVAALLAVVASTFYVYISSLTGDGSGSPVASPGGGATADPRGDEGVGDAAGRGRSAIAGTAAAGSDAKGAADTASPGLRAPVAEAKPGPVPTSAKPTEYVVYTDRRFGFEMKVPKTWRPAALAGDGGPLDAADYDVVFEDPDSGARLAASLWSAVASLPLNLWVMDAGRGMESVDGIWPTNGIVAGAPALILWAPETPTLPARYGAFVVLGRNYWRLAYSARDGGDGLGHFYQLLASFSQAPGGATTAAGTTSSGAGAAASSSASGSGETAAVPEADLVPPLPRPSGRYFPSSKLFK